MKDILIDELFINRLADIFKGEEKRVECPPVELVIAYAFDDLEEDLRDVVDEHLDYCTNCLELVLALRAAEAEAKEVPPTKMPDRLLRFIEDTDEKKDSSKVITVQFKKDLDIEEEKIKKWFETTGEYEFALAAMDAEKARRIILKIVEKPDTDEERLHFYEMEVVDECYDVGKYFLTGKVSTRLTFKKLIGCFGEGREDGKTKKYMAYQCRYDPETGLINFAFSLSGIPEEKIKQVIMLCR